MILNMSREITIQNMSGEITIQKYVQFTHLF